jgi:hypothetical protein
MNKLFFICCSFLLISPPVSAQQYTVTGECYRNVEQYIPSYTTPDGRYIRGYVRYNRESVPCGSVSYGNYSSSPQQGLPRCNRNKTLFNGLLGGAIAASVSKKDAYPWSIPLGVVLGASSAKVDCRT